eukprot:gnl/TRDRNA2_/TRDRNA2_176418_c11_seq3.p2 gnl/TRDRNA2_/TRDRNA2_176418_c11~~gnl/TRDRNA2_/TRDRNA2_176418_c11_seq3.p2  ORF type:complete len:134 (+),score=27.00 gnl/TRDRNA2_/TRDRNA2_176418_c11_seq3:210-611(+)
MASAAQRLAHDFTVQGLCNTLCAFVMVNCMDKKMFASLLAQVSEQEIAGKGTGQNLSNVAWAVAKAHIGDKLLAALARALEQKPHELTSQGLGSAVWAFASVKQLDEKLLKTLARTTEWRLKDLTEQSITNTA